jgi:membrane protease YdiL (CAAX protease family)
MSLPPLSEALLTQFVFIAAVGIFAAGVIFQRLRTQPVPVDEPLLEGSGPPPLPMEALDPGLDEVGPYAPPREASVYPVEQELPSLSGPLKVRTHWYRWTDLLGVAFFVFLYFSMQLGAGDKDAKPPEEKYTAGVLLFSMGFQFFCGAIAVGIMFTRANPVRWLGLRWPSWPRCFAIAPLSVIGIWVFTGLLAATGWNAWLEDQLHAAPVQEAVQLLTNSRNMAVVALMSFSAAIVAPLVEETIFRGYLYPVAKRFGGPVAGMLFSSLVFAAAHGSAVALLPLFVLAMLLCILYEVTGSLWANVSVHFLFNSATIAFQLLLGRHN